jgi:hypothetical protein
MAYILPKNEASIEASAVQYSRITCFMGSLARAGNL